MLFIIILYVNVLNNFIKKEMKKIDFKIIIKIYIRYKRLDLKIEVNYFINIIRNVLK